MTRLEPHVKTGSGRRLIEELPNLLQNDITLRRSEGRFGRTYSARVLAVDGRRLHVTLPRCVAGSGYLRDSTNVVVYLPLRGVLYEAAGEYGAEGSHTREVIVTGRITRTNRRRFSRLPLRVQAVCVPVSDLSMSTGRMGSMRWRRCAALDISGGGIMIQTPFMAPIDSFFLLNLEIESFTSPLFIFGQVRWTGRGGSGRGQFQCGLMFIPSEELPGYFSRPAVMGLPAMLRQFTRQKQDELNAHLVSRFAHGDKGE